jgi:hypothetical protein
MKKYKYTSQHIHLTHIHTHSLNIYLMRIFWFIDEFEVDSEATEKV